MNGFSGREEAVLVRIRTPPIELSTDTVQLPVTHATNETKSSIGVGAVKPDDTVSLTY